jgi:hypothetical protein
LRARLGADHFEVVFNLGQFAALEHERRRLRVSRRLYAVALPGLERCLGKRHPVVGRVVANLAALLGDLGETTNARALERRALRVLESALGARHPEVLELRRAAQVSTR